MSKQKESAGVEASAGKPNLVRRAARAANTTSGRGFVQKSGFALIVYAIFVGDWVPFLGGLVVRFWDPLVEFLDGCKEVANTAKVAKEAHDKKLDALAKSVTEAAFDPDNPAQHAAAELMVKTMDIAHPELKPADPPSMIIVHLVSQARLNVEADDPQPGDIAVLQMADAMGI